MEIFKLFGRIMVEDEASQSLAKVDEKAQKSGASLGGMIGTAAKVGAAVVTAGAAAGAGLFALANKISESTSAINDMSVRTGISTTRLQELQYAAGQAGVNFDAVQGAAMKLTKSMAAATDPTKGAGEAFAKLGVQTRGANGELLSSETVFNNTLAKLADMTNATERNALGMKLFGGKFTEIQPLVANGSAGLAAMSAEAHKLGVVLGADAISAGDQFGDTLDKMKQSFDGVIAKIGVQLMPMFQKMMDWVIANMPMIQEKISVAFNTIGPIISNLATVVLPPLKLIFEGIGKAVKFISDNINILLPVVLGLTAAFVAQQVIGTISGIYKTLTTATKGMTIAQAALNLVMNASPFGLVATAIGLAVTAGVLLYKNWDTIKEKASSVWSAIKNAMKAPINGMIGYVNSLINVYEKMLNLVGTAINAIPDIKIPKWVPLIGGNEFGIPKIPKIDLPTVPLLAKGGDITKQGSAIVGEAGPELLNLPKGAKVTPLDKVNQPMGDIVINIGGTQLARITAAEMNRLNRQAGKTILTV